MKKIYEVVAIRGRGREREGVRAEEELRIRYAGPIFVQQFIVPAVQIIRAITSEVHTT